VYIARNWLYDDGKWNASPKCDPSALPNATSDNYMQFYIGYINGAKAQDFDNDHVGDTGLEPHPLHERWYSSSHCGGNFHTDEYCAGYKSGWDAESALND
jgi:hypothetical protein